jgi:hypothetical protein
MLETLAHDIRDAFRRFRSRPGFAAVAVVTLALGIGANTAIFSLLNTLLFRDLPVSQPEQLVEIGTNGSYGPAEPVSFPIFDEIAHRQQVFSRLSAWLGDGIASVEVNGTLTRADFYTVDGNFYDDLGRGTTSCPSEVQRQTGGERSSLPLEQAAKRIRDGIEC